MERDVFRQAGRLGESGLRLPISAHTGVSVTEDWFCRMPMSGLG